MRNHQSTTRVTLNELPMKSVSNGAGILPVNSFNIICWKMQYHFLRNKKVNLKIGQSDALTLFRAQHPQSEVLSLMSPADVLGD